MLLPTEEILERVDCAWNVWLYLLDGIPEEHRGDLVTDQWTVKDLMGHVAYWEGATADALPAALAGQHVSPCANVQETNTTEAAARAGLSYQEQLEEMVTTHARLRGIIEANPPRFELDWVEGDTYLHYTEHSAQVVDWRKRSGI